MTPEQWAALVGAIVSLALGVGPWMFKVHAKLAVIVSKCADLCEKMEALSVEQRRLWETCSRHQSRLDTHEVQLAHFAEEMRRGE